MSRYIDADRLKEELREGYKGGFFELPDEILFEIDDAPTADVRENVRGRWLYGRIWWTCSQCKKEIYTVDHKPFDFCPNCGADMRGDKP